MSGTSVNFTIRYTTTTTTTTTITNTNTNVSNNTLIKEKCIVIVEDNKTNQIVLQKMLKKAGYTNIITYNNGLECINNINKIKEEIGVIFMDIHMPKMDGYTATVKLREYNIKSYIIACTANAMSGEKDKCKEYGMDDFILKPYQYTTLFNIMIKYFI